MARCPQTTAPAAAREEERPAAAEEPLPRLDSRRTEKLPSQPTFHSDALAEGEGRGVLSRTINGARGTQEEMVWGLRLATVPRPASSPASPDSGLSAQGSPNTPQGFSHLSSIPASAREPSLSLLLPPPLPLTHTANVSEESTLPSASTFRWT